MRRILIVDPQSNRRKVMSDLLSAIGWVPILADDPWQSLERLRQTTVHLAIINAEEQGSAGLALVHMLRSRRGTMALPVLMLGNTHGSVLLQSARRAGVSLCLDNALSLEDLLLRLALLMGNDAVSRAVLNATDAMLVDRTVNDVWLSQIQLLHSRDLNPGSLNAALEVLERLLSVRRDDDCIEAAQTLTRLPHALTDLIRWADRYVPALPRSLDVSFERWMNRLMTADLPQQAD